MENQIMTKNEIAARAKNIKMFLMDVDGVLTDGKMYYIPGKGKEMVEFKAFHSFDGIGLIMLNRFGVLTGVITGRKSPGTEERARNLGMCYAYQGFLSKLDPLKSILSAEELKPEQVAYMGDDWTDIPALKAAGLACAPANARPEVKQAAHLITEAAGGSGAVREVCDLILKSQGRWDQVMKGVETAHWPAIKRRPMKIINFKG